MEDRLVNTNKLTLVVLVACLATAGFVFNTSDTDAGMVSVSTSAPTVDDADIAMLTETDADYLTSIIQHNQPARGQTFTTQGHSGGYSLDAITLKSSSTQGTNGAYYIRIGTISGTDFGEIASESITTDVDVAFNDYVTFTLSNPVTLAANTVYGFDIGRDATGWYTYRNTDDTSYADGVAYSSGDDGVGSTTISTHDNDRVFHLNLTTVPEPTSITLFGLGLFGLIGCTQRKRYRG
jgi:hypothetical protein